MFSIVDDIVVTKLRYGVWHALLWKVLSCIFCFLSNKHPISKCPCTTVLLKLLNLEDTYIYDNRSKDSNKKKEIMETEV